MSDNVFASRLRQTMSKKKLDIADVVILCQPYCLQYHEIIDRNLVSRYIKGQALPKNNRIEILAKALEVDKYWLTGSDNIEEFVSKFNDDQLKDWHNSFSQVNWSNEEYEKIKAFAISLLNKRTINNQAL